MNTQSVKRNLMALCCLLICFLLCSSPACGEETELFEFTMLKAADVLNETAELGTEIILASDEQDVTGISAAATDGLSACINSDYGIQVERKLGSRIMDTKAVGLSVSAEGKGSTVTACISGRISAAAAVEDGNADAAALDISVSDSSFVSISVYDDMTAEARQQAEHSYTWAAGISLYNTDGEAEVRIDGDVTALSDVYGVAINSHLYGDKNARTKIHVTGDVSGTTYGILAEQSSLQGAAEIIVDGTVSGEYASILVDGSNREQALITVWKVETDEEGHSVHYYRDDEFLEPEPEVEKALQYIIRIRSGQGELITLEGTREYEWYEVAYEGDTVFLTLDIPSLYTLSGVYGDPEQTLPLEQDESVRYCLIVPRGGGVEVSVKLENADEYARLISDLYLAYLNPDEQLKAQIDADVSAIPGTLGNAVAEAWKRLFLDPKYRLYLYGTDDPAELPVTGRHAFVVLGYQLEDGEMALELVGRCEAAAAAARAFPDSILICSGGATGVNNPDMHTEAGMMKAYLTEKCGISPDRIFIDERAMTTTENARNTLAILQEQDIETMTIVTSSYHQKRGQMLYSAMAGRYEEEQGYSVKVVGNYCYDVEKDEDTLQFNTKITVFQLCDIIDLPGEQTDYVMRMISPSPAD